MKKVIKEINPFLSVFILLSIRYALFGAQLGDALVFIALCSLFAMDKYVAWKRGPDINVELKKQLDDIKSYVTGLTMRQNMKSRNESIEPLEPGKRLF